MKEAPNDAEIMSHFIRVAEAGDAIEVCRVIWHGPHTPEGRWTRAVKLPEQATPDDILQAQQRVLASRRWFRICQKCGKRKPVGWMHDGQICQGCAERYHGVVH